MLVKGGPGDKPLYELTMVWFTDSAPIIKKTFWVTAFVISKVPALYKETSKPRQLYQVFGQQDKPRHYETHVFSLNFLMTDIINLKL